MPRRPIGNVRGVRPIVTHQDSALGEDDVRRWERLLRGLPAAVGSHRVATLGFEYELAAKPHRKW